MSLDFVVQELTLQREIIAEQKNKIDEAILNLEDYRSQLIDGGAKPDSVLVTSIELIIKKLKK